MESSGSAVGEKLGQAVDVISDRTAETVDRGPRVVQQQIRQRAGQRGSQAKAVSKRMRQLAVAQDTAEAAKNAPTGSGQEHAQPLRDSAQETMRSDA